MDFAMRCCRIKACRGAWRCSSSSSPVRSTNDRTNSASRNFKAEDMVSLFQRLGVEYGSDVNAITTFDYTAYRLDFRENDAPLLREGLRLFRDFGDGVLFSPAIIERERRVVLAELRNRNTLSGQQQQASLPVVFRGLQFPQR